MKPSRHRRHTVGTHRVRVLDKNPAILVALKRGLYHAHGPLSGAALARMAGIAASSITRAVRYHCVRCEALLALDKTTLCLHVDPLQDTALRALCDALWPLESSLMYHWVLREYDRPPGDPVTPLTVRERLVWARRFPAVDQTGVPAA